jgi:hypothetical protein
MNSELTMAMKHDVDKNKLTLSLAQELSRILGSIGMPDGGSVGEKRKRLKIGVGVLLQFVN